MDGAQNRDKQISNTTATHSMTRKKKMKNENCLPSGQNGAQHILPLSAIGNDMPTEM